MPPECTVKVHSDLRPWGRAWFSVIYTIILQYLGGSIRPYCTVHDYKAATATPVNKIIQTAPWPSPPTQG